MMGGVTDAKQAIGVRQALLLGVVQGLTECLPVSSSAHLRIVPQLLRWPRHSLDFEIILHLGCLAGLVAALRTEWLALLAGVLGGAQGITPLAQIAVACLPAVAAGVVLERPARHRFGSPGQVAALTLLMGGALIAADHAGPARLGQAAPGWRESVLIGLAQALAFLPGVSRSGATLTAGVLAGLSLHGAVRFSFLLAVPILAGAGIWGLRRLPRRGIAPHERLPLCAGLLASALTSFATATWMLHALAAVGLTPFGIYRVGIGLLLLWRRL